MKKFYYIFKNKFNLERFFITKIKFNLINKIKLNGLPFLSIYSIIILNKFNFF